MSPDSVAKEMRSQIASGELSFSYAADAEVVIEMYRKGFIETFRQYKVYKPDADMVDFSDLGWRDSDAYILADALKFMAENDCAQEGLHFDVGIDGVAAAAAGALKKGLANDFSPAARQALLDAAQQAGVKLHSKFEENDKDSLMWKTDAEREALREKRLKKLLDEGHESVVRMYDNRSE